MEKKKNKATGRPLDPRRPFLMTSLSSSHFFLSSSLDPPLPQRTQPTTTATTQKPRKRPARTLVPGGLDASAFAPAAVVVVAAAASAPVSSPRRPAVAGAAAGAPPPPRPPPPVAPAPMLADAGEEAETEYERQRAERIRRNAEMLNALRVPEAAAAAARHREQTRDHCGCERIEAWPPGEWSSSKTEP